MCCSICAPQKHCAYHTHVRSGKACNDLLTKDYKVGKTTVEVKSKTPSGVTFTPTATKSGDSVSGTLKAAYNFLPWVSGEATFGTNGSVSMSCDATDALMKGMVLTAECERAAAGKPGFLASLNLISEYKSELLSCKASYDYYKADLLGTPRTPRAACARARSACAARHVPCSSSIGWLRAPEAFGVRATCVQRAVRPSLCVGVLCTQRRPRL